MNEKNLKSSIIGKKAFIFDMDGTILDLEGLNFKGYGATVKKFFGLELDNKDYQKYFSGTRTAEAFGGYLKSKGKKNYDVDELISDFRKNKRYQLKTNASQVIRPKKNAIELFKLLKAKKLSTCLATSTVKEFVDIILKHFDIKQYFDVVLTAEDVSKGKPDPQIYLTAIEGLQVPESNAVVFEDSKNGIASAKGAGILCVGFFTPGQNDGFVEEADFVIYDYKKIALALG